MLAVLVAPRWRESRWTLDWKAVLALSFYMVCFSYAYLTLTTGTGALLMFGTVQLTMFAVAVRDGEQFQFLSWVGLCTAFAGIVYLVAPGITAPDPLGAVLMIMAGVGWGAYSLRGRNAEQPTQATASNLLWSLPLTIAIGLPFMGDIDVSRSGVLLAVASGALATGVGYAIWYAALRGLLASQAATVQLSVPVIAALGGSVFLLEDFTLRILIASILTLGGIWLLLAQRTRVNA